MSLRTPWAIDESGPGTCGRCGTFGVGPIGRRVSVRPSDAAVEERFCRGGGLTHVDSIEGCFLRLMVDADQQV